MLKMIQISFNIYAIITLLLAGYFWLMRLTSEEEDKLRNECWNENRHDLIAIIDMFGGVSNVLYVASALPILHLAIAYWLVCSWVNGIKNKFAKGEK